MISSETALDHFLHPTPPTLRTKKVPVTEWHSSTPDVGAVRLSVSCPIYFVFLSVTRHFCNQFGSTIWFLILPLLSPSMECHAREEKPKSHTHTRDMARLCLETISSAASLQAAHVCLALGGDFPSGSEWNFKLMCLVEAVRPPHT